VSAEPPPIVDERNALHDPVVLGRISGLFGVAGWVRIFSHTSPRENILSYSPWYLLRGGRWERLGLEEGRRQGRSVVARLSGCADRDQAALLVGCDIAVRRDQLPEAGEDEYYWTDLEGLRVRTVDGVDLGVVDHLFETGANDVVVVRGDRERLIPYLWDRVVRSVDLEAGEMTVDWDPEL
jgi:16S rRNA processing protein RimM